MRIAEIYQSIQGEGLLVGTSSVFVRASGCNLRCWFCDTPFTSWEPTGEDLAVEEILARVEAHEISHVIVTGGEPMLFAELIPLCQELRAGNYHITIETAGTLYLPLQCDLMSISPKLANSTPTAERSGHWKARHEQTRHVPQVIHRLVSEYNYQLKFVVDRPEDADEVEEYLEEFPQILRDRVMLMPQGADPETLATAATWLVPLCKERGLRYCPRRHVELYGNARGK